MVCKECLLLQPPVYAATTQPDPDLNQLQPSIEPHADLTCSLDLAGNSHIRQRSPPVDICIRIQLNDSLPAGLTMALQLVSIVAPALTYYGPAACFNRSSGPHILWPCSLFQS